MNGAWRSLQVNPFIDQVNGRALQALAQLPVNLPKFVLQRAPSVRRLRRDRDHTPIRVD